MGFRGTIWFFLGDSGIRSLEETITVAVLPKKFLESILSGSAFRFRLSAKHVYFAMTGDTEKEDVQSVLWRIVAVPVMRMDSHLLVATATDGAESWSE